MNSLEFIQQQIANCNEQIDLCYERINENSLYKTLVEHYSQTINELKELKQRLEQIKAELEAWEIAKAKEIDILSVKTALDLESFNIDLVKAYQLTDYEFKTIKKALEVENEERN